MRRLALALIVVLSACRQEPDFDERYAKAARELRQKSVDLDAELATQAALSPRAGGDLGPISATSAAAD